MTISIIKYLRPTLIQLYSIYEFSISQLIFASKLQIFVVVDVVVVGELQFSLRGFSSQSCLRKLSYYFCRSDSHSIDASYQMLFSSNRSFTNFHMKFKTRFLRPFFVLNSMFFSIRLASLHVRKKESFLAFSVLVFGSLNNSFVLLFLNFVSALVKSYRLLLISIKVECHLVA